MSNVTAFPGSLIESDRRAEFLTAMAASFDLFVTDYGCEPDAYVTVMGGIKQSARISFAGWGETEGSMSSMLALAHATVLKELINPG